MCFFDYIYTSVELNCFCSFCCILIWSVTCNLLQFSESMKKVAIEVMHTHKLWREGEPCECISMSNVYMYVWQIVWSCRGHWDLAQNFISSKHKSFSLPVVPSGQRHSWMLSVPCKHAEFVKDNNHMFAFLVVLFYMQNSCVLSCIMGFIIGTNYREVRSPLLRKGDN